jgi:hypothetical protein
VPPAEILPTYHIQRTSYKAQCEVRGQILEIRLGSVPYLMEDLSPVTTNETFSHLHLRLNDLLLLLDPFLIRPGICTCVESFRLSLYPPEAIEFQHYPGSGFCGISLLCTLEILLKEITEGVDFVF